MILRPILSRLFVVESIRWLDWVFLSLVYVVFSLLSVVSSKLFFLYYTNHVFHTPRNVTWYYCLD
jgi:hypothetical protein